MLVMISAAQKAVSGQQTWYDRRNIAQHIKKTAQYELLQPGTPGEIIAANVPYNLPRRPLATMYATQETIAVYIVPVHISLLPIFWQLSVCLRRIAGWLVTSGHPGLEPFLPDASRAGR